MNCLQNISKLVTMMNQLKDLLRKIDRFSISLALWHNKLCSILFGDIKTSLQLLI